MEGEELEVEFRQSKAGCEWVCVCVCVCVCVWVVCLVGGCTREKEMEMIEGYKTNLRDAILSRNIDCNEISDNVHKTHT